MFNSVAFDVAIGLIFVFLLYSLLASTLQEMLASSFGMRSRMLERGIVRMLNDGNDRIPLLDRLNSTRTMFFGTTNKVDSLAHEFYNHPLIKYLSEDKWHNKPSYLNAQNFSTVIIDMLRGVNVQPGTTNTISAVQNTLYPAAGGAALVTSFKNANKQIAIEPETLSYLRTLLIDSNNDIEKFRTGLESWFNNTMDRASGWYKRHVQLMLFVIGFFVASAFNVNTISITKLLAKDPKAREEAVQMAISFDKENKNNPLLKNRVDSTFVVDSVPTYLKNDINQANSVLGLGIPDKPKDEAWICRWFNNLVDFTNLIGFFITACAISLGAPFWFDLLNKFINLRGAGNVPDNNAGSSPSAGASSQPQGGVKRVG